MHQLNLTCRQWWAALLLVVIAGAAVADDTQDVRKQVEASTLVTGTIDVGANGHVVAYTLDHADKLSRGIVGFVDQAIPHWRFQPIELPHEAARVRAQMTLRLVSRKLDGERYSVRLAGTSFVQERPPASEVQPGELDPPTYPFPAVRHSVSGTVYSVVRVGRDGTVEDVAIERVNLRMIASSERMQQWREILAAAALRAARKWTFVPPSQGEDANEPFWSVRVPVDFRIGYDPQPGYGEWEAYVPGPLHRIPWMDEELPGGSDALVAGGVYPTDSELHLLAPPEPSS